MHGSDRGTWLSAPSSSGSSHSYGAVQTGHSGASEMGTTDEEERLRAG